MRLIFFGMTGRFSRAPLERLVSIQADIRAVVTPATRPEAGAEPQRLQPPPLPQSDLPLLRPYLAENILHVAWRQKIPVWEVSSLSNKQTLAFLAGLKPDLIAVACFPYIFPKRLLDLPLHGCLNLHPSLLPAYRGPAPLFWIARRDERQTGVTLHYLDEGVDTGDIVAQTTFDRPEGISGAELETRCSLMGADLLAEAVQQLRRGQKLPRAPQSEESAGYHPWPTSEDFVIPTDWPAQRAFNFVRGAEAWPLVINIQDKSFRLRVAKSYDPDQILDQPYKLVGDEVWVQFRPGVLQAQIK